MSAESTQIFLANCKKNKSTVQGALSTALAISLLSEKVCETELDFEKTDNLVNSCPCNMRDTIGPKLSNEELVCASALLTWPQEMSGHMRLWDMVAMTTNQIRHAREKKQGLTWWVKLQNSIPTQPFSMMSSSMGLINLNETALKNFKLVDVRFLGANDNLPAGAVSCMTHASTCLGKFTFTLSYTYPELSAEWGKNFASNVLRVLEYFASVYDELDQTTLGQLWPKLTKCQQ